jgi:hypothetical protein
MWIVLEQPRIFVDSKLVMFQMYPYTSSCILKNENGEIKFSGAMSSLRVSSKHRLLHP